MNWESVRALYRYIWQTSRSAQIAICLLSAVLAPLSMVVLEFQRRIVDNAIDMRNVLMVVALGAAYLAVVCVRTGLKYGLDILKGRTVEALARDLRSKIMKAVDSNRRVGHQHPGDMNAGTIVSMIGGESEDLSGFAGDAFSLPILSGGTVLWVLGYLLWVEPRIAVLAMFIYFPQLLIVPPTQFAINRLGRMRIRGVRNLGRLAVDQPDKAPRPETTLGNNSIDRIRRIRLRIYRRKYFLSELGNFLDALGPIIVLTFGGYLAIIGETQASTLVVFISGLQKIADPWDQVVTFYRTISNMGVMHGMIRDKLGGSVGDSIGSARRVGLN